MSKKGKAYECKGKVASLRQLLQAHDPKSISKFKKEILRLCYVIKVENFSLDDLQDFQGILGELQTAIAKKRMGMK